MYYLTRPGHAEVTQTNMFTRLNNHPKGDTYTIFTRGYPRQSDKQQELFHRLTSFNKRYRRMNAMDHNLLYRHYNIPKKSGGLRPIDDPCDQLRTALTELKDMLSMFVVGNHTAAFAYVEGRSTIGAVKRLMSTNANFIAHVDFHNFFGGITPEFVQAQLMRIYPFAVWCEDVSFRDELWRALDLAFLNGGLPQGTNISPWLSNLIMVPFDSCISSWARTQDMVYIRYADDIYFARYSPIDMDACRQQITGHLGYHENFTINDEKTKQLRIGGPCFILGVSVGADKKITVGSERKNLMKVTLNNFCAAVANGNSYTQDEAMEINGLVSYCTEVEPEYFTALVQKYERKYHVNYKAAMKRFIGGN